MPFWHQIEDFKESTEQATFVMLSNLCICLCKAPDTKYVIHLLQINVSHWSKFKLHTLVVARQGKHHGLPYLTKDKSPIMTYTLSCIHVHLMMILLTKWMISQYENIFKSIQGNWYPDLLNYLNYMKDTSHHLQRTGTLNAKWKPSRNLRIPHG